MTSITNAAIRFRVHGQERIISVEPPLRHHDVFRAARSQGIMHGEMHDQEQGFITSDGDFVGRRQALRIATEAKQISVKHGPSDELFSEDLW